MTYAVCHADREHIAHGLCATCYQIRYRKDGKPRKRQNVMPEFEPDYQRILPRRTAGVRQNAVTSFPIEECPKCGRRGPMAYQGREARCTGTLGGCGQTFYLVKEGPAMPGPGHSARLGPSEPSLIARTSGSMLRPYASHAMEV